jgi:ATP/maltotriose-dependent transcriptional regulator MalT
MARRSNPETFSGAIAWTYGFAMQYGVLRADDSVVRAGEEAVQTAQTASSDRAMGLAAYTFAVGLLNRDAAADRQRGLELMTQARDIWLRKRALFLIPVTDVWAARETARRGDRDAAIREMRQAVDELRQAGNLFYGLWATGLLVETLLERGTQGDLAEAREEFDRLANLRADQDSSMLEITLLRSARFWPRLAATTLPIGTCWGVIARWRNRLASMDTSPGPRR